MQSFDEGIDIWFDLVARDPRLNHPVVQELDRISRLAPSKRNFDAFRYAAFDAPPPWKYNLRQFLLRMERGDYSDEFARFAGTKRQSSQVKELFLLFQQALRYD